MLINKAYKFRIYPNLSQQKQLRKEFAAAKIVYNYFLARNEQVYKETNKGLGFNAWCRELTILKKQEEFSWLNEVASQNLVGSLRDLDTAFKNFFRRVKSNSKEKGYPKFKKFNRSVRYNSQSVKYSSETHKILLSKTGWIKIVDYTDAFGKLMNITISNSKDDRWYASICVEQEVQNHINNSDNEIGIDMGIKDFLIDSNGNKVENPRFYVSSEKKRTRLQRQLSRKTKGSNNREKARLRLAQFEAKISAQRSNFLHQQTTNLTKNNSLIVHEDLNVKGMLQNKKLAKHISDASWGTFYQMLDYKGKWYDCEIRVIGRFYPSSKTCGKCGTINNKLTLKDREWVCDGCGESLDRDINAARNILKEGSKLVSANT